MNIFMNVFIIETRTNQVRNYVDAQRPNTPFWQAKFDQTEFTASLHIFKGEYFRYLAELPWSPMLERSLR